MSGWVCRQWSMERSEHLTMDLQAFETCSQSTHPGMHVSRKLDGRSQPQTDRGDRSKARLRTISVDEPLRDINALLSVLIRTRCGERRCGASGSSDPVSLPRQTGSEPYI